MSALLVIVIAAKMSATHGCEFAGFVLDRSDVPSCSQTSANVVYRRQL
jgi:hypothetical protein